MTYQTSEKPEGPSRRYQRHHAKRPQRQPLTAERKALLKHVRTAMGEEVYFVEDVSSGQIKIGYATDPRGRLYRLQCGNPGELRLLATLPHPEAQEMEALLHLVFHRDRGRGEWFNPTDELRAVVRTVDRSGSRDDLTTAVVTLMRRKPARRGIAWALRMLGRTAADWQVSSADDGERT